MSHNIFTVATAISPLSKEEQTFEWLKFKKGYDLLGAFYESTHQTLKLDNNFRYFDSKLVSLFKLSKPSKANLIAVREMLKSKDVLINSNLRMIIKLAHQFHKNREDIDLHTLIHEGTIGAIRALVKFKRFNYEKQPKLNQLSLFPSDEPEHVITENKVSSYIFLWAKCYVRNAIVTHDSIIKTPPKSKKSAVEYSFVQFDGNRIDNVIDSQLDSEIDMYALVKQQPDALEVLECEPVELALLKGISVHAAMDLREEVISSIRTYLTV